MAMTPGPWKLNGCELVGAGTLIATVHWHGGREHHNRADGRAMQAVPDLIAACEIVYSELDREMYPAWDAVLKAALTGAGVL